jgi:(R,R)-butanediol dehydrogenase/meso-butanediol dehydrogenase/diacetyl reductase
MITVQVRLCGVCGTDIAEFLHGPVLISRHPHPLTGQCAPITLGHEFSGTVVAVGDGVTGVLLGARVTADACWRCGVCARCREGDYHLCAKGGSIGLHSDGALAPLVQVPAYCVVAVPDGLDDVTAALTEPFAVGLHAFEETDIADGQRIVVVGFGTIGAAVAWWANQRGALVTVVEPSDQRRAVAGALGFGDSLDPDSVDVRKEIRDRTRGEGADAVVDCTGAPGLLGTSLELLRRRGILVLTSVTSGVTEIDPRRLVLFERQVRGVLGYRNHLPAVAAQLARSGSGLADVITEVVDLGDAIERSFSAGSTRSGRALKVLVRC